jgi:signal transduction histidine kinase/ActR/RegA family two-component response regulator
MAVDLCHLCRMSALTRANDDPPMFLSGGGVTGALARSIDWTRTPLGAPVAWPRSLQTVVGVILNSRHPMFLWWGPDLIQFYNDAYLPSFGQGKHPAAMGQPGRDCWREIWPIIWPQIDDVMTRRKSSWNEDALVPIFRNGRIEEVYWTYGYSPVIDETGAVGGTLVVCTETTARVIADRRSKESREVLENAHREREKLLEELESAGRAKDEFLAMLGHELRNPLSPIVTALQLMKLRGDATTTREQQVIERQVDHLVRLVDDLLDISKITRGKVELRRETVEIAEVIAKAVEIASMLFEQRTHQLTIDVPRTGLLLEGDPVRLAQVVANLLTNAARYTPRGGHIKLSAGRVGSEIVIRVRDNGVGITAEMLPLIFDLFVQGKQTADRAEGGLGIGLTLVKTLVTLHGGSVVASSQGPGEGSEFVIRLPAVSVAAAAISGPRLGAPSPFARAAVTKRVLLVDDNSDAADLLAEALREVGHQVEVANDPVAALEAAQHFNPEVAILDIGLPVMDGYELAAQLRACPGLARCRLIALTGYGQEHDRARSKSGGFERHLVKPVELDELIVVVADSGGATSHIG